MNDSQREYERRLHAVLRHIDAHLDEEVDLASLADVAHFSPFHFHRLFLALTGETLGDYLRRRRLEMGAVRLAANLETSILAVALSVGFGSGEAFSRAFKARFGESPNQWRRGRHLRNPDQADLQAFEQNRLPSIVSGAIDMKVQLQDLPSVRVAYLRHTGPYGQPVAEFLRDHVYPWMVAHGLLGQVRYGVGHDNPSITAPERCRYDACIELPPGYDIPRDMLTTELPGGRYGVFAFEGTVDDIVLTWRRLFRDWLPASGYQLDGRPCLEHYAQMARFDPVTGRFDCDLCIPVTTL